MLQSGKEGDVASATRWNCCCKYIKVFTARSGGFGFEFCNWKKSSRNCRVSYLHIIHEAPPALAVCGGSHLGRKVDYPRKKPRWSGPQRWRQRCSAFYPLVRSFFEVQAERFASSAELQTPARHACQDFMRYWTLQRLQCSRDTPPGWVVKRTLAALGRVELWKWRPFQKNPGIEALNYTGILLLL